MDLISSITEPSQLELSSVHVGSPEPSQLDLTSVQVLSSPQPAQESNNDMCTSTISHKHL